LGQVPTSSWYVGGSGTWIVGLEDIDDWLHAPPPIPGNDFLLYPDNTGSTRLFSVFSSLSGAGNVLRLAGPLALPVSVSSLTVYPTDTVEIADTSLLVELPGIVRNDGLLRLQQGLLLTSPLLPGLLDVSGSGQITMSGSGATIGSLLGAVRIDGMRINGRGLITGTDLELDSEIVADTSGRTIEITFGTGGTNNGIIRGTGGGRVNITPPSWYTSLEVDNAGGTLSADAGATLALSDFRTNVTVLGGDLAGGGTILLNTWVLLDSSTSPMRATAATLRIPGNTDAYVSGTIELAGARFWIRDEVSGFGTWDAALRASGAARLTGTGKVEFGPDGHYRENVLRADPGHSWDLGSGVEIFAPPGAIGEIRGNLTTAGRLRCDSAITVSSGTTTVSSTGELTGIGTIYIGGGGSLVIHGTTSPGNSTGRLTIQGSFQHTPGGRLRIEITPTGHDVLQINGNATLAGALDVSLADGFVPLPSQSFAVLIAGSVAGSFANLSGGRVPAIGGGSFAVSINGGTLTLSNFQSEAGSVLTYDSWRAQSGFFTSAEQADEAISGPLADPDFDGIPNQLEFAFGTHPRLDSGGARPQCRLLNGMLVYSWQRSLNAVGTLAPQKSTDPAGPWSAPGVTPTLTGQNPPLQFWELSIPVQSHSAFLRLRFTL
jgi:hypothetical protein